MNELIGHDTRNMRLFPAFSSLAHFERKIKHYSGVKTLKFTLYPGPLSTSVSCTSLFACVERTKVLNSSYSRDIVLCASFRPFVPSCTSKGRPNYTKGANSLNFMHHLGLLPTSVSSTRLFACVERTKVSNRVIHEILVYAALYGI